MTKKIKIIYLGQQRPGNQQLKEYFNCIELDFNYDFKVDPLQLNIFKNRILNSKYNRAIFLIDSKALILNELELIKQLPAHQIVYDSQGQIHPDIEHVLNLKEAISYDFKDETRVNAFLIEQFNTRQEGYKLSNDFLKIHDNFNGKVNKKGNSYVEFTGELSEEYQQIASWKMSTVVTTTDRLEVFPEFTVLNGDIELLYKFFLVRSSGGELEKVIEATGKSFATNKQLIIENLEADAILNVSVYAKGKTGSFRIGAMHIRRALSKGNVMIPGGKKIEDATMMNGELFYYFNAGDLKPPLAVYFSGYRSAEGFEGRGMMSGMKCPFMLIGDPRLEGGNFYLGNEELEKRLVQIILEKLELLGFKQSDLVLSGLSMGTFGSLYYASDLKPRAVIVGKPLVNVGTIALNEKINRPNGFPTSLDMLFYNTGSMTREAAEELNQRFWNKFEQGDYSETTFAFGYMQHDDYDKTAFKQLFDVIKQKNPATKVLYKGLIGRHNDNSPVINAWFLKQYRNILKQFNRTST